MITISNASTTDLRNKMNEWKEMTECNEHSDLLCDMAMFFEMSSEYVNFFFDLSAKEYLTIDDSRARYNKSEEMLTAIKSKHGEMIYKLILKAF